MACILIFLKTCRLKSHEISYRSDSSQRNFFLPHVDIHQECVTRVKIHNKIENIRHCMQKIEILIFFFSYEYIFHIVQQFHLHRVRSEARKEQHKKLQWRMSEQFFSLLEIMRSKIIFHAKNVKVSCHSMALSECL